MEIQTLEIIKIIIGSAGFLGVGAGIIIMVFRTGKIVQKIEDMSKRFETLENKVDKLEEKMDQRFKKLEDNLPTINIAITRLEVRLEERTLRAIEVPKKEISN